MMTGSTLYTSRSGFTLLELLVALAIFAVISVISFQSLASIQNTKSAVMDQSKVLADLQRALLLIGRDIEQAVAREIRDEYGDRQSAMRCCSGAEQVFEFSRTGWSNPLDLVRSNLQRVSYHRADGVLYRNHWQVMDRVPGDSPLSRAILNGIENLRFRFLYGDQWLESWPPDSYVANERANEGGRNVLLPRAVDVVLETKALGRINRIFLVRE